MSTILYRQLSATGEPQWGQGAANYLSDVDAVAQAVLTRLSLFQGEWWENLEEGVPLWQSILALGGISTRQQEISLILRDVILGTPYVTGTSNMQINFDSNLRVETFYAEVQTQFGSTLVSF